MHNPLTQDWQPDSRLVAHIVPSPNCEERREGTKPSLLILHYTGMDSAAAAIGWLAATKSKVSCHYVVDEAGAVTQMVPEALRAWHAGASHWLGQDDVNSQSIGIEIHNPGHEAGYPDFPPAQMQAVAALCADIVRRHQIAPQRVLAHSDVAPRRKIDPGEKFPWGWLHSQGVGHWVPPAPFAGGEVLACGDGGTAVMRLQRQLRSYGYGIDATGFYDEHTKFVVTAFQRHFRPFLADGRADNSTVNTLDALLASLPSAAVVCV
jgi:N-acetylmuramoyl-L-alanine amidase